MRFPRRSTWYSRKEEVPWTRGKSKMHWEKRIGKVGEAYCSFIFWNGKLNKNVRLKRGEIPSDMGMDRE